MESSPLPGTVTHEVWVKVGGETLQAIQKFLGKRDDGTVLLFPDVDGLSPEQYTFDVWAPAIGELLVKKLGLEKLSVADDIEDMSIEPYVPTLML